MFIRSQVYKLQSTDQAVSPSQFFRKIPTFFLMDVKTLHHHLFKKKKKKDASHSYREVIRKITLVSKLNKEKIHFKGTWIFVCFTILYKVQRNPREKTTPYNIVLITAAFA